MKKTVLAILALIGACSLCACSLFSNGAAENGNEEAKSGDIVLCDTFTHHDPTDVEFTTRYACTSGESQDVKDAYKQNYGIDALSEYWILYASADDVAVAEYDYYVFATAEDAQKFADVMKEYGSEVTLDGQVAYVYMDEAMTKDFIAMQMQYCGLKSDKASDYAQFWKEGLGYMDID